MYPYVDSLIISLFHSTLFLSVAGIFVYVMLRVCRCKSPKTHGIVWTLVLLQGIICFRFSFEFPVLNPPKPQEHLFVLVPPRPETPRPVPEYYDAKILHKPVAVTPTPVVSVTPSAIKMEPPPEKRFTISRIQALFFLWLAGLSVLVVRQMFLYAKMILELRKAEPASEVSQTEWETLLRLHRISPGRIRLLLSDTMGPGLVKTPRFDAVVVPRPLWEETDFSMRQGILKHEISHFRHGDLLKSCVFRLIAMVHWFNPMAWFALRRFDDALEWRADSESFGTYEDGCVDFAKTLLVFRDTVPVTALCRRDFYGRNIIERSRRLLENMQNPYGDSLMKKTFVIFCATILFLCGFFQVSLTPRTTAEETQSVKTETKVKIAETKTSKPEAESPNPAMVQVQGKMLFPDGSPATVAMKVVASGIVGDSGAFIGSTLSPRAENFTLDLRPNVEYIISVFDPQGRFAAASQPYSTKLEAEDNKEIVFQLEEGVKVEGTVVQENTDDPVPNLEMHVSLYPEKRKNPYLSNSFRIATDEQGRYRFAVTKDQKEVYVSLGNLPMSVMNYSDSGAESKLWEQVDFDRISDVNGVSTIKLDFRIPPPFMGRVLDPEGSPVSGTYVTLMPSRPRDRGRVLPGQHVSTDSEGYFRIPKRPKNVFVSITHRNLYLPQSQRDMSRRDSFLQGVYIDWIEDDSPQSGVMEFRLRKPCIIAGRLVDSETKKPLADQLLLLERSSKENPERLDFISQWVHTNENGEFSVEDVADNVRYELYVVPGMQEYTGSTSLPRVILKTVMLENPAEKIDLGDLEVDDTKAVVKEEPIPKPKAKVPVNNGPDAWLDKLFSELHEKVKSGEKKALVQVIVKKEALPGLNYILENSEKEPLASCALFVMHYETLSEGLQKEVDKVFQSDITKFKGESLYLVNTPESQENVISLSQLRGESPSKWNVPSKEDAEWKITPGAINPDILKKYLEDMLKKP